MSELSPDSLSVDRDTFFKQSNDRMNSLKQILPSVLDAIRERRHQNSLTSDKQGVLIDVLERVVDGTDVKIRLVPGYRRKLLSAVEGALEYADRIIEQFPQPLDLSPEKFISDPYANAFFVSPEDLARTVGQSSELHDYFDEGFCIGDQECCVLLCMLKTEKNILGMEISGGQVMRDVKQTSVSFSGHKILSPSDTEDNVRQELKCCIFEGLITNALSHIVELRAIRRRLESEQRILGARLRSLESSSLAASEPARNSIKQELADIEERLTQVGYLTPEAVLQQVSSVLRQPEKFLSVEKVTLEVDKMGIKKAPGSQTPCNRLELLEVKINGQSPRIVSLVKLRRSELTKWGSSVSQYI